TPHLTLHPYTTLVRPDPRPPAPGQRNRGAAPGEPTHNGSAIRGGLAKQLLDDVRTAATHDVQTPDTRPLPQPTHPQPHTDTEDTTQRQPTHAPTDQHHEHQNAEPDSWLRTRVAELRAGGGGV